MNKNILAALVSSVLMVMIGVTHAYAQGIMTTWIGNGTAGYDGDGGRPGRASINAPHDVCFDVFGNFYFIDQGNNVIRQISAATGYVYTIAGDGTQGYYGDGWEAPAAALNNPAYLCTDQQGNIYFSDAGNNAIRKINAATRIITTIAGNGTAGFSGDGAPAINALLSFPQGICIDAPGNIYFADAGNNRVKKISITTGIITTIAGDGNKYFAGDGGLATSSSLNNPICVCFDPSGNLYVADQDNFRIRRITKTTGIITSIAGSGTTGFSGDGSLALNAKIGQVDGMCIDGQGDIYINDISCSCRKISAATGNINVIAGNGICNGYKGDGDSATSALMSFPAGLCVDPSNGNIIIADAGNNRIRIATQPGFVPANIDNKVPASLPVIFPDPSSGKFAIQVGLQEQDASIDIYNALGEIVYKNSKINGTLNTVDISDQPPGIYFINIRSVKDVQTIKMLIK